MKSYFNIFMFFDIIVFNYIEIFLSIKKHEMSITRKKRSEVKFHFLLRIFFQFIRKHTIKAIMSSMRQNPLTCSGHTRPVVHLSFSRITPDGYFLISASKGFEFIFSITKFVRNIQFIHFFIFDRW